METEGVYYDQLHIGWDLRVIESRVTDYIGQGKILIFLFQANETPAYFTDYCWPAVEYTREQFENAGRTRIAEGKVNPFRGPIRIHSPESEIPRLSNGVLFHLVYSSPGTEGELKRQTI